MHLEKKTLEYGDTATHTLQIQEQPASYFKKRHMPLGAYTSYIPSASRVQKRQSSVIIITTLGISASWVSNNQDVKERQTTSMLCTFDNGLFLLASAALSETLLIFLPAVQLPL